MKIINVQIVPPKGLNFVLCDLKEKTSFCHTSFVNNWVVSFEYDNGALVTKGFSSWEKCLEYVIETFQKIQDEEEEN